MLMFSRSRRGIGAVLRFCRRRGAVTIMLLLECPWAPGVGDASRAGLCPLCPPGLRPNCVSTASRIARSFPRPGPPPECNSRAPLSRSRGRVGVACLLRSLPFGSGSGAQESTGRWSDGSTLRPSCVIMLPFSSRACRSMSRDCWPSPGRELGAGLVRGLYVLKLSGP